MTELDLQGMFDEAVHYVKTAEENFKPDRTLKLKMYALFKQATQGDVTGKKPSLLDPIARAKYKAWLELKGMTNEIAQQTYVAEVNQVRKAIHH